MMDTEPQRKGSKQKSWHSRQQGYSAATAEGGVGKQWQNRRNSIRRWDELPQQGIAGVLSSD